MSAPAPGGREPQASGGSDSSGVGQPHRRPHRLPGRAVRADGDRPWRRARVDAARPPHDLDAVRFDGRHRDRRPRRRILVNLGNLGNLLRRSRRGVLVTATVRGCASVGTKPRRSMPMCTRTCRSAAASRRARRSAWRVRSHSRKPWARQSPAPNSRLVAQRAEHLAGVPCGVMDQMASVHGRRGHALRRLSHPHGRTDPTPTGHRRDRRDSGMARRLADSEYV